MTVNNVGTFLSGTTTDGGLVFDANSNGIADPGDIIQYNGTVTNNGPDNANNVTYTAVLDGNTTFVPDAVANGVVFADNFNRAVDTLGANWTKQSSNPDINGANQLEGKGAGANTATVNGVAVADVVLQADFNLGAITTQAGLVARYQGTGDNNMYVGMVTGALGARRASIWRNLNGAWTRIANVEGAANSGTLRFEAIGSLLKLFIDGTQVLEVVDTSFRTGLNGVRLGQGGLVDNFSITRLATQITDDFNRADNASLGASFTETPGFDGFAISGNTAAANGVAQAHYNGYVYTDVSVQANVNLVGSANTQAGVTARHAGVTDQNMYYGTITGAPDNYFASLWKNINGAWTRLDRQPVQTGSGLLRLDVIGAALKLYLNESLVGNAVDTSLSSGFAGIRGVTNGSLDNFSVKVPTPAAPFVDNFNAGNNTSMNARFSEKLGDLAAQVGDVAVENNRLVGKNAINQAVYLDTFSANVNVQMDVDLTVGSTGQVGLMARYQGVGETNMYLGLINCVTNPDTTRSFFVAIWKNVNGVWTRLDRQTAPAGAGTLRFEVIGSQLKLFLNGTQVSSATDTSLQSAGLTGVRLTQNMSLDNFSVTTLSAAGLAEIGDPAGSTFTRNLGTLTPGQTANVSYRAMVNNQLAAGVTQLTHNAILGGTDSGTSIAYTPATTTAVNRNVNAAPDLRIALTSPAAGSVFRIGDQAPPGGDEAITYVMNYANVGNQNATGAKIQVTFPFAMAIQAGSTPGWTSTNGGTVMEFNFGNLNVRANGTLTLIVKVNQQLAGNTRTMNAIATILDDGSNGGDLNPANNSQSREVTINGNNSNPFGGI